MNTTFINVTSQQQGTPVDKSTVTPGAGLVLNGKQITRLFGVLQFVNFINTTVQSHYLQETTLACLFVWQHLSTNDLNLYQSQQCLQWGCLKLMIVLQSFRRKNLETLTFGFFKGCIWESILYGYFQTFLVINVIAHRRYVLWQPL